MHPENYPVPVDPPEDPGMTAWEQVLGPLGPFSPILPVSVEDTLTERHPRMWEYIIGGIPGVFGTNLPAQTGPYPEHQVELIEKDPAEMTPEEVHAYMQDRRERFDTFRRRLTHLINELSMEQDSDTPDFLIAEYLIRCLKAYNFSHSYRRDENDGD